MLEPLHMHVVIKTYEKDKETKSGILVHYNKANSRPVKWEVVAVWPWDRDNNWVVHKIDCVKPGDVVYFQSHETQTIEHDGEEYMITNVYNLLAKDA